MASHQLHPSPRHSLKLKLPFSRAPHPVFSSANKAATGRGAAAKDVSPPLYAEGKSVSLPAVLRPELMPKHVAIIMDGNRRWARMRELSIGSGYEAGIRTLRRITELCGEWGIRVLTVFAFSSDNWFRPKVETDLLMGLFEIGLRDELQHLMSADVRISFIGDSSKLLKPLQLLLAHAMETTENNKRLHLIIAVNYTGKTDIVQACQRLAVKVKDGHIELEDINEFSIEKELETNCTDFPNPDLLIRTSGEVRISNFLLWQLAYTELYFSRSLWPDFGEDEFLEALCSFQGRQRRYGGQKF